MNGSRRKSFLSFAAMLLGCRGPSTTLGSERAANGADDRATTPVITLERTECFGICPVYKVTIGSDAVATYEGVHFVKLKGHASAQLSSGELDQLRAAFARADFFSFQDSYEKRTQSDAPTAILFYAAEGKTKSVRHYEGDDGAPSELRQLEKEIDEAVHVERWIGTAEERLRNVANWK